MSFMPFASRYGRARLFKSDSDSRFQLKPTYSIHTYASAPDTNHPVQGSQKLLHVMYVRHKPPGLGSPRYSDELQKEGGAFAPKMIKFLKAVARQ